MPWEGIGVFYFVTLLWACLRVRTSLQHGLRTYADLSDTLYKILESVNHIEWGSEFGYLIGLIDLNGNHYNCEV